MSKPGHHIIDVADFVPGRQSGPVDHQDGHAKGAGGDQLGAGAFTAGVLRYNPLDPVGLQKRLICICIERATVENDRMIRQRRRGCGRISEAEQVVVLRLGGETRDLGSANGEEDVLGCPGQRRDGGVHVGHMGPAVALFGMPRRTGQRDQWNAGGLAGLNGVPAHLVGEGMRGVDQVRHSIVADIGGQPFDAAEPAGAHRDRLRPWCLGATGIGQHRVIFRLRDTGGKGAGVACTAEDEKVGAHV